MTMYFVSTAKHPSSSCAVAGHTAGRFVLIGWHSNASLERSSTASCICQPVVITCESHHDLLSLSENHTMTQLFRLLCCRQRAQEDWQYGSRFGQAHFFGVFRTGSGSTSLLDMCTASGGGPLGQLSLTLSLVSMSIPLQAWADLYGCLAVTMWPRVAALAGVWHPA